MKKLTAVICAIAFSSSAFAEEAKKSSDPFDLSGQQKQIEELGLPTKSSVDALEAEARDLFTQGKCAEAIPTLNLYAKRSNHLANLITSGLEPYYSASYDDRKGFRVSSMPGIVDYERQANDYKRKRNIAFAMQGECLLKTGKHEEAVPVLVKALDLIDIDNTEWWKRTLDNLYSVIEVTSS